MLRFVRVCWFVAALGVSALPVSAQLATKTITTGLEDVAAFVQDPVAADTFYLLQTSGTIRVLQNGVLLPTPLLDVSAFIKAGGEQGLLGLAFSPDTASRRLFVNFINATGDTVVARFTRREDNPLVVDPASRLDLQWADGQRLIARPGPNHNGGHLTFGPDGFLYIGLGDGLDPYDPNNNAQNPLTLLGKMLRIDVNVPDADPRGYRIPESNPFVAFPASLVHHEIWAFGLRNPWRYSFDNVTLGGTGALLIGDVGQLTSEEVNYEPAGRGGRNYGWRLREGAVPTPLVPPTQPAFLPLTEPLFDYPRTIGRSVTGGYVYRGAALPASFRGRYFVGDFMLGFVGTIGLAVDAVSGEASVVDAQLHTSELGGAALAHIVSFAEDRDGELYVVQRDEGTVYKIVPDPGLPLDPPTALSGSADLSTVTLTWQAPLTGVTPRAYLLEVGNAPGASNLFVGEIASFPTRLAVPNIADATYYARLRSIGSTGAGAASTEATIVVGCTAPPPAPTGLTQVVVGNTVALGWAKQGNVSSYVLEAGSASGLANLAVVPLPASSPGFVTPAPNGKYFVRVRAQNSCGVSEASSQIEVVVPR